MKRGAGDKVLFSKPGYVSVGNPFVKAAFDLVRKEDRSR